MKKIRIDATKLQLKKQKIAKLTPAEMIHLYGAAAPSDTLTAATEDRKTCQQCTIALLSAKCTTRQVSLTKC